MYKVYIYVKQINNRNSVSILFKSIQNTLCYYYTRIFFLLVSLSFCIKSPMNIKNSQNLQKKTI